MYRENKCIFFRPFINENNRRLAHLHELLETDNDFIRTNHKTLQTHANNDLMEKKKKTLYSHAYAYIFVRERTYIPPSQKTAENLIDFVKERTVGYPAF